MAIEPNTESVIKNSLAVEQKDSFESKDIMIQYIRDAIESLDVIKLRKNF